MGYHLKEIPRGVFGEFEKIEEEVAELKDALEQNNRIMALVELSDLLGAIDGFLDKHFSGFSLDDLLTMSEATKRAFEDGTRE